MAACQDHIVLASAVLEILFGLIVSTVVDNSLKDEFVFSQSSGFVESHCTDLTSQRNLFRFADEDLSFLEL